MSNFEPNAILRGAQLTIVGAHRALQNPGLFKHEHYKQAIIAIAAGIIIQLILSVPVLFIRGTLLFSSMFINLERATWDDLIVDTIHFLQHSVLQLPFFLMTLMKYVDPALDNMFMESLAWVDQTYVQKHKTDSPAQLRGMYHDNLLNYNSKNQAVPKTNKDAYKQGIFAFLNRSGRKAGIAISVYLLTFVPYIGKLVLPAFSFYTLNKTIGPTPAIAIFATGIVIPKRYFVMFLQTFFSSRSMMRELLEPYFSRVYFTRSQKKSWFLEREGVLFGFGVGFFLLSKIPYLGVLIYGIAEASTAYLITKITDPPPPVEKSASFAQSQILWRNKKEFLTMPLTKLDGFGAVANASPEKAQDAKRYLPERQFA